MHAKIIRVVKTSTDSDMPTNEEETFQERKLEVSAHVYDAPTIEGPGGVRFEPNHIRLSESFTTSSEDPNPAHYRIVNVTGLLVRKDGTLGKTKVEGIWRMYSSPDVSGSPPAVQQISDLVVTPFTKGEIAQVRP